MKWPIKFKIYVAYRHVPDYYDVFIHKNRKLLFSARKKIDHHGKVMPYAFYNHNSVESVTHVRKNGEEIHCFVPLIGEIHFANDHLTFSTICHELFHAVIGFGRNKGVDLMARYDEEMCATLMDELIDQMLTGIDENLKGKISSYTIQRNKQWFKQTL